MNLNHYHRIRGDRCRLVPEVTYLDVGAVSRRSRGGVLVLLEVIPPTRSRYSPHLTARRSAPTVGRMLVTNKRKSSGIFPR